jgi:UDP-N-acetylmuramoylalanine--D-glutamate ligase
MDRSPQIAGVLNITPNHLDRHRTMQAYTDAKARVLDYQSSQDVAVLNRDDPGAWDLRQRVKGDLISFGREAPPPGSKGTFVSGDEVYLQVGSGRKSIISLDQIQLVGDHNQENVLAACALAAAVGISPRAMREGASRFRSLPHRLEFVRSWGGADWYNDSIATAPERSMAAIQAFDRPLILLAGGRDKDLPWTDFVPLVHRRVEQVIVFGELAGVLEKSLKTEQATGAGVQVTRCDSLKEAVEAAARQVRPGYIVLLSPGGTSFDEFRDFEDRGESFKRWVKELT